MDIKTTIQADITTALRQGNSLTLSALRLLMAAINNSEIDKHATLTDGEIITQIQKQVKQRREAIELYQKGNRLELADKEEKEIEILNKYLPQQMSTEEVSRVVVSVIAEMPADQKKNFGLVMKAVMAEIRGQSDGNTVARIVKETIGLSSN